MSAIVIRRTLDSDTLYLPELKPLIGKTVEIVVRLDPAQVAADEERWKALFEAAGKDLVDPEVYKQQREFDRLHGQPPEL